MFDSQLRWIGAAVLCHGLMTLCLTTGASEPVVSGPNLLSLERMGAGVPAGWHVNQSNAHWDADPTPGPLGVGAARIRFDGRGHLDLFSPARVMESGVTHAFSLIP